MRRLDEYELTQHYQYWREDLDLLARSGADSLRWGIPWYRVEPEPGRFEWDWVDRVVDHICRARPDVHRRPDALRHAAVDDRVVRRPRLPLARRRLRRRRGEPLRRPPRRVDAAQRAQRQRRLLRPARGVAAVPHRARTGSPPSPCALAEGIVATQRAIQRRAAGRLVRVRRGGVPVRRRHVPDPEGGARGAAVRGPRPRPRPRRRRSSDARAGSTSHGADAERLDRLTADPVMTRRRRRQLLPGLLTVRFDDAGAADRVEAGADGLDEVVRTLRRAVRAAGDDHRDESWRRRSRNAGRGFASRSPPSRAARRRHPARRLHVVPVHRPHRLGLPRGDDTDRRLDRADGNGRSPPPARRRHTRASLDRADRRLRRGGTAGNARGAVDRRHRRATGDVNTITRAVGRAMVAPLAAWAAVRHRGSSSTNRIRAHRRRRRRRNSASTRRTSPTLT